MDDDEDKDRMIAKMAMINMIMIPWQLAMSGDRLAT
jgi:hypothetical protein